MAIVIEITDPSAPELAVYADLIHGNPHRSSPFFLAESEKVIRYALKAGCKPISFLMERKDIKHTEVLTQWQNIPVYSGSRQIIQQLTGYTLDRGFLCAMERPSLAPVSDITEKASRLVLLRNISDPTDLGAIFRSAAALGMDGILIGEGCCDPLYRRAVRVSMGTVFQIPWTVISNKAPLPLTEFNTVHISQHPCARPLEPEQWKCFEKLAIIFDPENKSESFTVPTIADAEALNMPAYSAVLFWMLQKR